MPTYAPEDVTIQLWGPVSPTFGRAQQRRGILAGDFALDLTMVLNKAGACIVTISDTNAYLDQVLKRDTNAVVYLKGKPIYSGHIEEQEVPLVPGGDVEFEIIDVWTMFLEGTLAYPNPVAAGFAEVKNSSGTVTRRNTPWTIGELSPTSYNDLGQAGIGDREEVYAAGRTPLFSFVGSDTSMLMSFPGAFNKLADDADSKTYPQYDFLTGCWNPRFRKYPASVPLSALWHFEGTWVAELVRQNVVERLGYDNLIVGPQSEYECGKYVWYHGTSVEDPVPAAPEDWRYGPMLRFDDLAESIEDFLATVGDPGSIRAAIRWREGQAKWELTVREVKSDLSQRPLTVTGGEIVSGSAKLGGNPVSYVVVGGAGDGHERAMAGRAAPDRWNETGWVREVFAENTSAEPVWEGTTSSGAEWSISKGFRIPKYHRHNDEIPTEVRAKFVAQLRSTGTARLADGARRDTVSPVLQETEAFTFYPDPEITPDPQLGYDLGTRVDVEVPGLGVVYERVTKIRLTLDADSGLTIVPTLGEYESSYDLSIPLRKNVADVRRMKTQR